MTRHGSAMRAEVLFAVRLVGRHRATRFAALLGVAVLGLALGGGSSRDVAHLPATVLLIGATLTAVAASRPLARGAPLAAARRAAGPAWLAPAGRLLGVLALVLPSMVAAGLALLLGGGDLDRSGRLGLAAAAYVAALGALTLPLSATLGGPAAAGMAFAIAWLGGIPPSGVAAALAQWPLVQRPLVWLWNALPLEWRVERWLAGGPNDDLAVLVLWIGAGLAGAAWAVPASHRWTGVTRQATS